MPPLGMLMGGMDFGKLSLVLKEAADPKDMVVLRYGMFIGAVVDFTIIAFAIFIAVKMINRLKKAEAPAPPDTKECPKCCSAIPVKATKCPNCTSEVE